MLFTTNEKISLPFIKKNEFNLIRTQPNQINKSFTLADKIIFGNCLTKNKMKNNEIVCVLKILILVLIILI